MVWTRNLTPDANTGLQLSLAEFKEALRTGRDFHTGQSAMLVVMPWPYLRWESDQDLEGICAYLRAIPPVSNPVPADHKDGLGLPASIPFPNRYTDGDVVRALPASDRSLDWRRGLAITPEAIPPSVKGDAKRAYGVGSYLANATIACNKCHTHPDRAGSPPRVNTGAWLTGGTVYLGTLVDETPPRPLAFPMFLIAQNLRNLLDPDLEALYAYLDQSYRTVGASDVGRQPPARYCTADAMCGTDEACTLSTHECAGGSCVSDADCGTCQTCDAGACHAPDPASACLLTAQ